MRVNGLTLQGRPRIETNTGVDWGTLRRGSSVYAAAIEMSTLDKLEYREGIIIDNRRSTNSQGEMI